MSVRRIIEKLVMSLSNMGKMDKATAKGEEAETSQHLQKLLNTLFIIRARSQPSLWLPFVRLGVIAVVTLNNLALDDGTWEKGCENEGRGYAQGPTVPNPVHMHKIFY